MQQGQVFLFPELTSAYSLRHGHSCENKLVHGNHLILCTSLTELPAKVGLLYVSMRLLEQPAVCVVYDEFRLLFSSLFFFSLLFPFYDKFIGWGLQSRQLLWSPVERALACLTILEAQAKGNGRGGTNTLSLPAQAWDGLDTDEYQAKEYHAFEGSLRKRRRKRDGG